MTNTLRVGCPVVRQSVFGDWLVDDGSLVPQRATDRRAAFDEAAARQIVPPVDALRPRRGGQGVVDGSGSSPAARVHSRGGNTPGPAAAPPAATDAGPGAPQTLFGVEVVGLRLLHKRLGGSSPLAHLMPVDPPVA